MGLKLMEMYSFIVYSKYIIESSYSIIVYSIVRGMRVLRKYQIPSINCTSSGPHCGTCWPATPIEKLGDSNFFFLECQPKTCRMTAMLKETFILAQHTSSRVLAFCQGVQWLFPFEFLLTFIPAIQALPIFFQQVRTTLLNAVSSYTN